MKYILGLIPGNFSLSAVTLIITFSFLVFAQHRILLLKILGILLKILYLGTPKMGKRLSQAENR